MEGYVVLGDGVALVSENKITLIKINLKSQIKHVAYMHVNNVSISTGIGMMKFITYITLCSRINVTR